jgi:hypothetical protein
MWRSERYETAAQVPYYTVLFISCGEAKDMKQLLRYYTVLFFSCGEAKNMKLLLRYCTIFSFGERMI